MWSTHKPTRRFGRWRRWLIAALVVVVLGVALESIPSAPGHAPAALLGQLLVSDAGAVAAKVDPFGREPHEPCNRIEASYGVGNHLLKNTNIGFYASVWPSFLALDAFFVRSLKPGHPHCAADFSKTLRAIDDHYWSGPLRGLPGAYDQGPAALHAGGDLPRVDDSLWMGVTLMNAYERTKRRAILDRAEAVFRLARANWDPHHGGIYWEDHPPRAKHFGKAVVSNAPAAIIALEIYLATGERGYLDWGEKIVAWLQTHLLDQDDGLYNDHVDDRRSPPTIARATFTYNQGVVAEALGLLSTIAPRAHPLGSAISLARRAMRYFKRHHSYGHPAFDAVWATNVLWLAALADEPSFTAEARASLEAAIHAEPKDPSDLLGAASEIALGELATLSPHRYAQLAPEGPNGRATRLRHCPRLAAWLRCGRAPDSESVDQAAASETARHAGPGGLTPRPAGPGMAR